MFELRWRQKGLAWRAERGFAVARVNGDAHKLRQVLINLLGNAIKFTVQGEVELGVGVEGTHYRFNVSDTGPGIAPEDQETVFQPFRQDAGGATAGGGTGLGLAIARQHIDEGFDGFIDKPYRVPQVYACLAEVLDVEFDFKEGTATPSDGVQEAPVVDTMRLSRPLHAAMSKAVDTQSVSQLKEYLDQLESLGGDEQQVAAHLRVLAQNYDMEGLRQWLERLAPEA